MSFTSQKTLRADIVAKLKTITLLATDTDTTAHVVPYFEPNPRGISPFACVDSAGMLYNLPSEESIAPSRFVIGVWVRRDDPATAEDQLNDLAASIAGVLSLNYLCKWLDYPQSDFEVIDGIQYKFELYHIEIVN